MRLRYVGNCSYEKEAFGTEAHECSIGNTLYYIFLIVDDTKHVPSIILRYNNLKELLKEWEEVGIDEK